jgi:hypothetical protein
MPKVISLDTECCLTALLSADPPKVLASMPSWYTIDLLWGFVLQCWDLYASEDVYVVIHMRMGSEATLKDSTSSTVSRAVTAKGRCIGYSRG